MCSLEEIITEKNDIHRGLEACDGYHAESGYPVIATIHNVSAGESRQQKELEQWFGHPNRSVHEARPVEAWVSLWASVVPPVQMLWEFPNFQPSNWNRTLHIG